MSDPVSAPQTEQQVTLATADGWTLAGRLFLPDGEPLLAIVLHGATGVPRDYYAKFAAWLAGARQAAVLIYDYRDCGWSARGPVRAARSDMGDWAVSDQAAALDWLAARYEGLPLEVVGHSLGGMGLPFHEKADRVRRLTTVATGPSHWTRHPLNYIGKAAAFWFVLGPVATLLLGYLPGRILGQGEDLPARAFWQWRRWCTTRGFYRRDWGRALPQPDLTRMTGEVRLIAVADDPMIPPPVVRDHAAFFPAATISHLVVKPQEVGVKTIGHLRLFSERCKAAWPLVAGV